MRKASFNQQGQRIDGRLGIRSAGPQSECRTVYCSHRQQVQDAFAVDDLISLDDFDLAAERLGNLDEHCSRAGVKALRVDHDHGAGGDGLQGSAKGLVLAARKDDGRDCQAAVSSAKRGEGNPGFCCSRNTNACTWNGAD